MSRIIRFIVFAFFLTLFQSDAWAQENEELPKFYNGPIPEMTGQITAQAAQGLTEQAASSLQTVLIDFEGIGDLVPIGGFYVDQGVQFSPNFLSLVSILAGGNGNFINNPSGDSIGFWLGGDAGTINVAGGFTDEFSTFYASAVSASIEIWSGLDATGVLLATVGLSPTPLDPEVPNFATWVQAKVEFEGVGHSIRLVGAANLVGFDNISFGSECPKTAAVIADAVQAAFDDGNIANFGVANSLMTHLELADSFFASGHIPQSVKKIDDYIRAVQSYQTQNLITQQAFDTLFDLGVCFATEKFLNFAQAQVGNNLYFPKETGLTKLLRGTEDDRAAHFVVKIQTNPSFEGHCVQWEFIPEGTVKGTLPANHASRFEKTSGFIFNAETTQGEVNAKGSAAVRVNLPDIPFNRGKVKATLLDENEEPTNCVIELDLVVCARVVIDPGHGGDPNKKSDKKPGSSQNNATSSSGVLEKDMTLGMAKLLETKLNADSRCIEVTLTRSADINLSS